MGQSDTKTLIKLSRALYSFADSNTSAKRRYSLKLLKFDDVYMLFEVRREFLLTLSAKTRSTLAAKLYNVKYYICDKSVQNMLETGYD